MLGLPYDTSADMWSAGCTLYEIYTGNVMFPGKDNNEMLKLIFETKGEFPRKLLRKGKLFENHFDAKLNFQFLTTDRVTGEVMRRALNFSTISRLFGRDILKATGKCSEQELKKVNQFKDLIDSCLALETSKRLTPEEALKHPFFYN